MTTKTPVDLSVDYYGLLGIDVDASLAEIAKAYRRKALTCHPDKVGPDNVEATNLFLSLNKAYEVLSNHETKAQYDTHVKAKLAKQARYKEMDETRRKMKDELERAEQAGRKRRKDDEEEKRLFDEVERLKEDGMRKLRERQAARVAVAGNVGGASSGATWTTPPSQRDTTQHTSTGHEDIVFTSKNAHLSYEDYEQLVFDKIRRKMEHAERDDNHHNRR